MCLLLIGTVFSCTQLPIQTTGDEEATLPPTDSVFIYIQAHNLSEDMSKILSTKNDELLILIYKNQTEGNLSAPLFHQQLVMDANRKEARLFWKTDTAALSQDLLFLLIEQDYDRPLALLDSAFRQEHTAILRAHRKRDYQAIKDYLGAEDLLGYKIIRAMGVPNPIRFKIEGVHKLDLYEYDFQIQYRRTGDL